MIDIIMILMVLISVFLTGWGLGSINELKKHIEWVDKLQKEMEDLYIISKKIPKLKVKK